jgi:hypothetical protein
MMEECLPVGRQGMMEYWVSLMFVQNLLTHYSISPVCQYSIRRILQPILSSDGSPY